MQEIVGCIRLSRPRTCTANAPPPPSIRLRHGDLLGSVMANTGPKTKFGHPPESRHILEGASPRGNERWHIASDHGCPLSGEVLQHCYLAHGHQFRWRHDDRYLCNADLAAWMSVA